MGFCLAITRTSCQRWEQFFETQVMEVSETPSLKNLASGCFRGCCLAVVSYLFEIPRTVTHQAPLCMFGQEYWSGLPFPSPGDLLRSRIEPAFPALVGRYFTWFFSSCGGILELQRGSQASSWVGTGKPNLPLGVSSLMSPSLGKDRWFVLRMPAASYPRPAPIS